MKKIFAFGDSFVSGDQDDFEHEYDKSDARYPTHGMDFHTRDQFLKYNVSFISIIAKRLEIGLVNLSERGSGTFPQIDILLQTIRDGKISRGDIVFFGFTTLVRDRLSLLQFEKTVSKAYGACLIDKLLVDDQHAILENDLVMFLLIIDNLSKFIGFKIFFLHLFDTLSLLDLKRTLLSQFNFTGYIGQDVKGNTCIDILNDTWGKGIIHKPDLSDTMSNHLDLYTYRGHPSIKGHQKIAEWLLSNVNWNDE